MIYRVIITISFYELWFDFNEYGQAMVFAEAAKLKNVPTKPTKYGSDHVESVKVKLMTMDEHKTELKSFEEELEQIRRELKEEEAAKYAE